jgi:hypothetical protein
MDYTYLIPLFYFEQELQRAADYINDGHSEFLRKA